MNRLVVILLLLAGCAGVVTPGNTPTASLTPTASNTPLPTNTPKPTETDDRIEFYYPPTITVTPWNADNSPLMIQCILRYFELLFTPGKIIIERRNKGDYYNCLNGG